ncbi:MAG: Mobile element protein [Nitrospira sp.]|nr:MAG: Mobile element protein [Nitrospira sp.]
MVLSETDRATLGRMSRMGKAAQRDVLRARIILLTAAGGSDLAVAEQLRINRHTVRLWRQRFAEKGLEGLTDTPGRGRKPILTHGVTESILTGAVQPPPNRTRWSCRSMAKAHKVSKSTVQRLWSKNDIKPHVTRTFKISTDPRFEEKFWDVIGCTWILLTRRWCSAATRKVSARRSSAPSLAYHWEWGTSRQPPMTISGTAR